MTTRNVVVVGATESLKVRVLRKEVGVWEKQPRHESTPRLFSLLVNCKLVLMTHEEPSSSAVREDETSCASTRTKHCADVL